MRLANLNERLVLVVPGSPADGLVDLSYDVAELSEGQFAADPQAVYERWDDFVKWASAVTLRNPAPIDPLELGSPAPRPRQVFGIGLNYRQHVEESGFELPEGVPPVFTKFPSCITGPRGMITIPDGGQTDWEVELVVIVGRAALHVGVEDAMSYVAGYSIGQDLSERRRQMAGSPPQFSLGKSLPRYGPVGPWLVTIDEFDDPHDLELGCTLDGEQMQRGRTSELIFTVPALISRLSSACQLLPGDVIFSGTPAGVGLGMNPQRWIADGEELVSTIENIGEMRHTFVMR